jgi:hypothetical protein
MLPTHMSTSMTSKSHVIAHACRYRNFASRPAGSVTLRIRARMSQRRGDGNASPRHLACHVHRRNTSSLVTSLISFHLRGGDPHMSRDERYFDHAGAWAPDCERSPTTAGPGGERDVRPPTAGRQTAGNASRPTVNRERDLSSEQALNWLAELDHDLRQDWEAEKPVKRGAWSRIISSLFGRHHGAH